MVISKKKPQEKKEHARLPYVVPSTPQTHIATYLHKKLGHKEHQRYGGYVACKHCFAMATDIILNMIEPALAQKLRS